MRNILNPPKSPHGPRTESEPPERRSWPLGWLSIFIFFLIWEGIARTGWIRPIFISSPVEIIRAAGWLLEHGYWRDLFVSATEFFTGLAIAMLIGLPLGVLVGWYRSVSASLEPFITGLYSTPRVALMPLLVLWLGIGAASKIAVVVLGAVFPVLVSTMSGVRSVDEELLTCARSFGASDRQVFLTLALPASVPYIISGFRLGVGRGLVGVVVGELIAARAGVGHRMNIAAATFQTDQVFVGILVLATTGIILNGALARLERHFDRWRTHR